MSSAKRPRFSGLARWLFMTPLALGILIGADRAAAVPDDSGASKKETPATAFPPAVEEKFVKLLAAVKAAKRKLLQQEIDKEIKDSSKFAALSPETVKALEDAAQQAVDNSLDDWARKIEPVFRKQMGNRQETWPVMFDQMLGQAEAYATENPPEGYVSPADQPAWSEAIKRTLTAEQAAAWEKARADRLEAFKKETATYLKLVANTTHDQFLRSILSITADIKRTLGLEKERAAALDSLGKDAVGKSVDILGKRIEKMLFQMDAAQRRPMLKGRNFYYGTQQSEKPDKQPIWKDGLAKLLSPDELKRLETVDQERQARRTRITAILMLADFDEKVAFTSIQRQRLQPLVTRVAGGAASESSDEEYAYSVPFSAQGFMAIGAKVKEEELKDILDPVQRRHWKEASVQNPAEMEAENGEVSEEPKGKEEKVPQAIPEPEDYENALSDFLQEKTALEKKKMFASMILKAEDAARVTGLGADAAGRLETAARGAAEKTLLEWKMMLDQSIRSMVQTATPENVRQRLRSIEYYNLPRDTNMTPDADAIWKNSTKEEISAPQLADWKKELDERSAYRARAIGLAIMEEFDRRDFLSAQQWEKLEPIVIGIVKDYLPEIGRFFTFSNGSRWYMQAYSMFIPIAGVPENDLKAILGKDQWQTWAENPEFSNAKSYWSNLQQNHAARVRVQK